MIYAAAAGSGDDDAACILTARIRDTVTEKRRGLAHFVEHLVSRYLRTSVFPELVGSPPPPDTWSATTHDEYMEFKWWDVPVSRAAQVAAAFLHAVRHHPAALSQQAFDAERASVLRELAWIGEAEAGESAEAIEAWMRKAGLELAFPGSPHSVDPAGILAEVGQVRLPQLASYASRLLDPGNCAVIVTTSEEGGARAGTLHSLQRLS